MSPTYWEQLASRFQKTPGYRFKLQFMPGTTTPLRNPGTAPGGTATVTVDGLTPNTLLNTVAAVNQTAAGGVVGFAAFGGANLFLIANPAFASYTLGLIGPTSGPVPFFTEIPFATGSGGSFELTSVTGDATFSAVPLPATLPLFATGLGALVSSRGAGNDAQRSFERIIMKGRRAATFLSVSMTKVRHVGLTIREREVVLPVERDLSNGEIARKLDIKLGTGQNSRPTPVDSSAAPIVERCHYRRWY